MNMGTEHTKKEQAVHQPLEDLIERGRMLHSRAIYHTFAGMAAFLKQKLETTAAPQGKNQGLDFS